jgi:hypothetical protein
MEAARRLDPDTRARLDAFVATHPDVAEYARFLASREAGADPHVEESHVLAQYLADQQLRAIAEDPKAAALALDLPIGSHPQGYEVWADGSMFAGAMSVGAPPDIFFSDGQDWGFPPPLPRRCTPVVNDCGVSSSPASDATPTSCASTTPWLSSACGGFPPDSPRTRAHTCTTSAKRSSP